MIGPGRAQNLRKFSETSEMPAKWPFPRPENWPKSSLEVKQRIHAMLFFPSTPISLFDLKAHFFAPTRIVQMLRAQGLSRLAVAQSPSGDFIKDCIAFAT